MAYAETHTGQGFFSHLFSAFQKKRENYTEYRRVSDEVSMMDERELQDLGYSRSGLQESVYRHYFQR